MRASGRRTSDGEQMGAQPEHRGFALDRPRRAEDRVPPCFGLPPTLQVPEPTGKTLDPDEIEHLETDLFDVSPELLWLVEIRGGEPFCALVGIAMLTFCQIALDDRAE